jgi:uncharacterized protein
MKDFTEWQGKWALIAGAAEGIGAAFTVAVAAKGMNIIMVDVLGSSLKELASKVEKDHRISTVQLEFDLSEEKAWIKCMNAIENLDCRLLIYVPAYSPVKLFTDNTPDELDKFINLNCRTPVKMVLGFAKRVGEEKPGGIILMSSLAGLTGPQFTAPYAATKAFTNIFGEALYYEFKRNSIDMTVCCAGPVSTPAYWSSQPHHRGRHPDILDPGFVAEFTLENLGKKAICIPGWKNRLIFFFLTRLLPRKTTGYIVNKAITKRYPQFEV